MDDLDEVVETAVREHQLKLRSDTLKGMRQGAITRVLMERHGIELDQTQQRIVRFFVGRFLDNHPEYDINHSRKPSRLQNYPCFSHAVDIALLFTMIRGYTPVTAGKEGEEIKRRVGWYSPGDRKSDGTITETWQSKPKAERADDLYLLSKRENGIIRVSAPYRRLRGGRIDEDEFKAAYAGAAANAKARQTDKRLLNLIRRLDSRHGRVRLQKYKGMKVKLPRYLQALGIIGIDGATKRYFGHEISPGMVIECLPPGEHRQLMLPFMQELYEATTEPPGRTTP